jgi:integrase/recombinase XerD
MRKKRSLTLVEKATILVPEFKNVEKKLSDQVTLRGQSPSTLTNYIRRIALFVIHFERLPEQVSEDEANEYLVALARDLNLLPGVVLSIWYMACGIITAYLA